MGFNPNRGQPGNAGQFAEGPKKGLTNTPTASEVRTERAAAEQVTRARAFDDAYARFQARQADPVRINCGTPLSDTPYTGLTIEYRNYRTGQVRTEWTGELHGTWDAATGENTDPATDLLAHLEHTRDGWEPHRAILSGPHPTMDGAVAEYQVPLVGGTISDLRARSERRLAATRHLEQGRRDDEAARAAGTPITSRDLRKGMRIRLDDGQTVTTEHILHEVSGRCVLTARTEDGDTMKTVLHPKDTVGLLARHTF